jgi:hypothetical protein
MFPKARLSPFPTGGKSSIFAAKYAPKNTSPPTPCPKIDPLSALEDRENFPFLFVFLKKERKSWRVPESSLFGDVYKGGLRFNDCILEVDKLLY